MNARFLSTIVSLKQCVCVLSGSLSKSKTADWCWLSSLTSLSLTPDIWFNETCMKLWVKPAYCGSRVSTFSLSILGHIVVPVMGIPFVVCVVFRKWEPDTRGNHGQPICRMNEIFNSGGKAVGICLFAICLFTRVGQYDKISYHDTWHLYTKHYCCI